MVRETSRSDRQVKAIRELVPLATDQRVWIDADRTIKREVVVQATARAGFRAIVFRVDIDWLRWSTTSSARMDGEGVNQFTEILAELVDRIRPNFGPCHRPVGAARLSLPDPCGRQPAGRRIVSRAIERNER
ncbi:hypothetical protein [Puerhibacterium sp. TATVAM-FAB25]|uniref:hypothetical protein n=1 Tax=Puerhibacterium sp. TATVAM-FAB25 TaxID=3093699 RepID=UPI003978E152